MEHVHTGRELELMLLGRKPLALFYAEESELPEDFIPEDLFGPYVADGRFLRDQATFRDEYAESLGRDPVFRYVLFCVPDEAWRIPAMKLLLAERYRTGLWNETLERIEGKLLGYTEEENDLWCASRFAAPLIRGPDV